MSISKLSSFLSGRITLLVLLCSVGIYSCDQTGPSSFEFDRNALLERYWDVLIIPSYETFLESEAQLNTDWLAFKENTDVSNLALLKESMFQAWKDWQQIAHFDFGPFADFTSISKINTHPTDSEKIELLISSGTWDITTADNTDINGFPALDYLFNSEEALTKYSGTESANRIAFTEELIAFMSLKEIEDEVNDYRTTFLNANGTDAGSSLGFMINAMNRYLERNLKDGKIGIPLGERTLGIIQPNSAEALYDGRSVELLEASILAYQLLFEGADGLGLDDYVKAAEAFQETNPDDPIDLAIADQFDEILMAIDALNVPISEGVSSEPEALTIVLNNIQKLIILLKIDMPSQLGILITYQDNDGD